MRKLKIKEANNGYVLMFDVVILDNTTEFQMEIIEDQDDERGTIKRLLIAVADHFGFHYDPFSRENINITFSQKGDEVE